MTQVRAAFEAAVEVLVADGPIKTRLCRAFESHLEPLEGVELPASVTDAYRELQTALHRVGPVGRQTCVYATVQKMSSCEAASHAARILSIYTELLEQNERTGPLKIVEQRAAAAAPRFLTKTP